jgi:hypothetical protein
LMPKFLFTVLLLFNGKVQQHTGRCAHRNTSRKC